MGGKWRLVHDYNPIWVTIGLSNKGARNIHNKIRRLLCHRSRRSRRLVRTHSINETVVFRPPPHSLELASLRLLFELSQQTRRLDGNDVGWDCISLLPHLKNKAEKFVIDWRQYGGRSGTCGVRRLWTVHNHSDALRPFAVLVRLDFEVPACLPTLPSEEDIASPGWCICAGGDSLHWYLESPFFSILLSLFCDLFWQTTWLFCNRKNYYVMLTCHFFHLLFLTKNALLYTLWEQIWAFRWVQSSAFYGRLCDNARRKTTCLLQPKT